MTAPTLEQQIDAMKQRIDDWKARFNALIDEVPELLTEAARIAVHIAANEPERADEIAEVVRQLTEAAREADRKRF